MCCNLFHSSSELSNLVLKGTNFAARAPARHHSTLPCDQGKMQHKDMKFWNCGPTRIWHNIESVAFFFKITPPCYTVL